jgi:outer membrane protein W
MKKTKTLLVFFSIVFSFGSCVQVQAQSTMDDDSQESVLDRLYFKLGATNFNIRADSSEVNLSGFDWWTELLLEEGPVAGSGVEVNGSTNPSITVGYRLPWGNSDSWSIETVIAPPFEIDLKFTGSIRDQSLVPDIEGVPTEIPALGPDIGELETLPVTVTLLYTFDQPDWLFVPYVGAGFTYIYNKNQTVTNSVLKEVGEPTLETSNDLGWVLQAGLSAKLSEHWLLNADLKYASGITIESEISGIAVNHRFSDYTGPATIEKSEATVDLDIFVVSLSAEYRF